MKMEEQKLKVGIIGCGYWGPNLIRNFDNVEGADLYYICDVDETKMLSIKANYPKVKTTRNYHEIINDSEVDTIVIALPVLDHYPIAKDGLLANKHVLVEKPMTSNVEEAKELIRIAKEKNKILMVDHTFEYSESIKKMKEIIESGELGDIYYVKADWLNLGLLQPNVNVIWDLATHIISIMNYITNLKAISINSNAKGYIRKDIPEIAQAYIRFPKGISAYITVSWLEPKKTRKMTIAGSKKMLICDQTDDEEPIKIYDKGVDIEKASDIRPSKMVYRYGDIYSPHIENIEPLNVMCRHFIYCIKNNKKPRTDGESGLNVVKVLEAAEKSIKNNGAEIIIEEDII